jgi:hypothetical protein
MPDAGWGSGKREAGCGKRKGQSVVATEWFGSSKGRGIIGASEKSAALPTRLAIKRFILYERANSSIQFSDLRFRRTSTKLVISWLALPGANDEALAFDFVAHAGEPELFFCASSTFYPIAVAREDLVIRTVEGKRAELAPASITAGCRGP